MFFHKKGECRSISAKPTSIQKEKYIPRLPENSEKLYRNFRFFHFHSYNNIAVISHYFYMWWYVSNTYYSPVYFHTNSTYFIRSTPMYSTRLGRNFYVTNTYLPSSYSKLGMNILLRTRYVATDLVTSQNFQPIRCVFTLFHFGRTRDVYVATRNILLSSTAESSATGCYVAATEGCGQSDAELVKTWNGLRKSLVSFQKWIYSMQYYYQACNYDFLWLF